jgi:hypothetical protein
MTPPLSQQAELTYVFVALLGLVILRRAYAVTHGARISTARLAFLPVFYVIIYVAELAALGLGGVGTSLATRLYISFAADAALVAVGAYVAYGYTLRHLQIYRAEGDADWWYRLNPLLPVAYVVLFFARVAIETVLLGETPFAIPSTSALEGLSTLALGLFFLVDALWGLSTGFLVGRNAAVYHEWRQTSTRADPGSSPALL